MRVLCIWLPNWPSQRVIAAKSLAENSDGQRSSSPIGPLILHQRDPRRGRLVVAANATARQFGIVPQMPLSQTESLCPNALVLEHDPHADTEALCALAETAQRFSPVVGIETIDPEIWSGRSIHQPQSLMLNIDGIGALFGSELQLATEIFGWLANQGLLASIAIANTTGAAWALANYQCRGQIAKQMLAIESGAESIGTNPFITIDDGQPTSGEMFYMLPIDALRLEIATVSKLHRLGIRTIGQLVELPRNGLATRFGDKLLARIDQTLYGAQEVIQTLHAKPELASEIALEHPTNNTEDIRHILSEQVERVVRGLDQIGHGALRIVCRLDMERNSISLDQPDAQTPATSTVIQLGLFQPSNDVRHIMWLLTGQIDGTMEKQSVDLSVRGVSVQATLTAPVSWQQNNLFDADTNKHRDEIARLIDGLSARMGRTAVVSPSIVRDPLPELSFAWRPLTGFRRDGTVQETKRKLAKAPRRDFANERGIAPSVADHFRRPLHLFQPAKKLRIEKKNDAGLPTSIIHMGQSATIVDSVGPERVDSGWWNGPTRRRDYYRIEIQNGSWLWIYQDKIDSQWYSCGEFD